MLTRNRQSKGLTTSATLHEVLSLTRELDLADRAKLAEQLLASLDEPSEVEVEKFWIEEAKRRLAAYRAGQDEAIPAEEVFRPALALPSSPKCIALLPRGVTAEHRQSGG